MQVTGQQHLVLAPSPDDIMELDDEHAISQRPHHYAFRTTFLQAALKRLACVNTRSLPRTEQSPELQEAGPSLRETSSRSTARRRQRRLRLVGTSLRASIRSL